MPLLDIALNTNEKTWRWIIQSEWRIHATASAILIFNSLCSLWLWSAEGSLAVFATQTVSEIFAVLVLIYGALHATYRWFDLLVKRSEFIHFGTV
jgi:hypothetical protein